jgi:hypothetical protein
MSNDPAEETVEIQWVYTPADFFDGKIERDCKDYSVEIEGGHATARISAAFYRPGGAFQHALAEELRSYFRLWQLDRRKVFEIRGPSVRRVHPNGTRDITIVVDEVVGVLEAGTPNIISTDANGVVHDARQEHFEAMRNLVELKLRHAFDPKAHRMLESHASSIAAPGEELVYLYEIWDALMEKFEGGKIAQGVLNIPQEDLNTFNDITCERPLRQGRHRGRFNDLRDATAAELIEARRIAQLMMEGYWKYLDDQQRAK